MALLPDVPATPVIVSLADSMIAEDEKNNNNIVSEIHEHGTPEFARVAIDRLYGSLYASVRYLELCRPYQPQPHTWIGYQQGEIQAVLLFEIREHALIVISEMIALTAVQIENFARCVLARYPSVMCINFNAVNFNLNINKLNLPAQHYVFSENYILNLPKTIENYQSSLGRATHKTIRLYGNRLKKDFPDFAWRVYSAEELPRALQQSFFQQIQAYKNQSMMARNKTPENDPAENRRILQLASESGLFSMAVINGEIRSGSLACRVGNNYVMLLSAADPALEKYRLGLLTCYWSLCDCITRGAQQCHLLWGRYQYKSQLLAVPVDLQRITLYRSRWIMAAMSASVIRMALQAEKFRIQKWLLYDVQQRRDVCSRTLAKLVFIAREFKRKLVKPGAILRSRADHTAIRKI